MVATLTAYALVVQVLLAAVGNGAALAHALSSAETGVLCLSATVGTGAPPSSDGTRSSDLCCIAPVLVGTAAPVVNIAPALAVLRSALTPRPLGRASATITAVVRARAPPGIG